MAYEFLAGCYDAFTADVHYARWADYLEKHFARSRLPIRTVLDLACGTGTIACLLPATSFYLGATFAPARQMVEADVPVAVASDFNPGSTPNLSLQLAMNIACYRYRLTPEEVLTAATLNAAAAIGKAEQVGTLEPGKQADLLIWDADNLNFIFYRYGNNLVKTVIKKGKVVKHN